MPTTTILFTDLVGSSDLLGRVGDRKARQIFGSHYQSIRSAVEAFDGEVIKWQGDGIMARFQSVWDALRAAVASQRAAEGLILGERLGMRAGLHVGDTLSWEDIDLFGTPVVVASRLCEAATSGQILCSSTVIELLPHGHNLELQEIGPSILKGIEGPVTTFQVQWRAPASAHQWTEDESELFLELAEVAIPARDEQIATVASLLPFHRDTRFGVLELGAGEGALAHAILECYPNASVTALDGSEKMRGLATRCLQPFGKRASVIPFQLASPEWWPLVEVSHVVVSSLLLHHLPDTEKERLFEAIHDRMQEPGALLVADVVKAQRSEQRLLLADTYDAIAREQSFAKTGSDRAFEVFHQKKWNMFRPDSLPEDEHPASLIDILTWLRSTGFEGTDCFWMRSGFVVFGGFKGAARTEVGVSYADALRSARRALEAVSEGRQRLAG